MSDTTDTARGRTRQEPTFDTVCREVRRLTPPAEAELAVAFAEIFLAKAPVELARERAPETLANLILGTWRFVRGTRDTEEE